MTSKNKFVFNLPNILSLYRLLSFPFLLTIAILGYETLFVWLFCINLITDILDGLIARLFHMQTELGARLDSLADIGSYILAVVGIFLFHYPDFQPVLPSFLLFLSLFVLCQLIPILRFGAPPSFHLYSWKIGGYLQGAFFFVLFAVQFYTLFYWIMLLWGIAAFVEHLIIQALISSPASNLKGLYWVLRNRQKATKKQP
ncbi:MAG: CDP-alcohol phosphatidyltransferase family protein [Bacteroidota bacterium]